MRNWAGCNGIFTQNNIGLFCNIFFNELDIANGIRCRVQTHERYFHVREATPLSFADNLLNIVWSKDTWWHGSEANSQLSPEYATDNDPCP